MFKLQKSDIKLQTLSWQIRVYNTAIESFSGLLTGGLKQRHYFLFPFIFFISQFPVKLLWNNVFLQ